MSDPTLQVHHAGRWSADRVRVVWSPCTYRAGDGDDRLIDSAWAAAKLRLGERLFDGPMCRFESFSVDPVSGAAELRVSRTSYRVFLGTNMAYPDLPAERRANPVGVSTGLVTVDGCFLLGRRSGNVAYYPHKLHPFAGSLEPREPLDLFAEARRELHEELSLAAGDIQDLSLLGLVEDLRLRHPELILLARTTLARLEVERRLDPEEHAACWACPDTPDDLAAATRRDPEAFTPVGLAAIALRERAR